MAKTDARWLNLNADHFDTSVLTALTLRIDPAGALSSSAAGLTIGSQAVTADMLLDGAITDVKLASTFLKADGTIPLSSNWDVGNFSIIGLVDTNDPSSAATRAYVDSVASGLYAKAAAKVATTENLDATYASPNTPSQVGSTLTSSVSEALVIDGVTLEVGDRVLVKDQGTLAFNGIYEVTDVGSVSTNWVLTRADDSDESNATVGGQSDEVASGNYVFITSGTVNADSGWVLSTDVGINIGVTPIEWVQFSSSGSLSAGDGLEKVGSTLNVLGDEVSLTYTPSNYTPNVTGLTGLNTTDLAAHLQGIDIALASISAGGGAMLTTVTADVDAGAIQAGDTVTAGTTLDQFVDQLLSQTFYPTFVNPSVSLSSAGTNSREIGSSDDINLSTAFSQGLILGDNVDDVWDAGAVQAPRSGGATGYTYIIPGQPNISAGTTLILTGATAHTITAGTNTFQVTVDYTTGLQPVDSEGNNFGSPLGAGSVNNSDTSIQGVYPWFWAQYASKPTTSSVSPSDPEMNKVVASSNGTLSVPWVTGTDTWLVILVPATSTDKQGWKFSELNKGNIEASSLFTRYDPEVKTSENVPPYWVDVAYDVYISNYITNPAGTMDLTNTLQIV